MPKYRVNGTVTVSIHTKVEATSPEEAIEIAHGRVLPGLCYQCGGSLGVEEEWRTSGELDGEPEVTEVEEL